MTSCYARLARHHTAMIQPLVRLLRRVQRNPEFRELPLHSPDEFVPVCDVYAALRALGYDCAEQRGILQRVVRSGILGQMDRPPQGHMEVRLSARAAALEPGNLPADWRPVIIPISSMLDDSLAYALTHTIMFQTDFGHEPWRLRAESALAERLNMLLVRYSREKHYDLLAECLLCWACVRLEPTMITDAAWKVLLRGQHPTGAFPAHAETRTARLDEDEAFRRQYHTTLICVIAGSLWARHAATRPVEKRRAGWQAAFAAPEIPPAHLAAARSRAMRWLLRRDNVQTNSVSLCYRALGAWIGGDRTALSAALVSLAAAETGTPLGNVEVPITLKILVAALLEQHGKPSGSMRRLLTLVSRVLTTERNRNPALHEKRLLLHRLGLGRRPPQVPYSELLQSAKCASAHADDESADALLLRIECASAFGTRPIRVRAKERWLRELLAGISQQSLRSYEWSRGCRALRALAYLDLNDGGSFESCLQFIVQHQTPDGAFGFFRRNADQQSLSATKIAVTVDCLWTLAEVDQSRRWRLFAAIPPIERPHITSSPPRSRSVQA